MPWTDRDWTERHQFFRDLPEGVRSRLPPELHDFIYKPRGSLAQLYYADPRVHFEAWFHWRTSRLELGLHFEKDERTNDRLFEAFDRHIVEIKASLGESIDLERWDKGWCRLYETWPCEKPDRAFRQQMTDRFARIIAVLEPIYESVAATMTRARG